MRLRLMAAIVAAGAGLALAGPATTQTAPLPPGVTAAKVAAGEAIYKAGTCGSCHGPDAKGTLNAPDLTSGVWLWGDGSVSSIEGVIAEGVAAPKKFPGEMPPSGAMRLSDDDLSAVAAYVWSVGRAK